MTEHTGRVEERVVASIPSEEILVRSSIGYVPQYVKDIYGRTERVTKDVTFAKLLRLIREDYPKFELVSIGTPVNFDIAPTHLTRVEMRFDSQEQVEACLKEISVSDALIRTRIQPAWDWQAPIAYRTSVTLHVGWYDTVYFMTFKDIFLGQLHCRYSAKFGYDPREAKISHFRYDDHGDLELITSLSESEKYADLIKEKVEFIRRFRDGSSETT
ncbi:hypothetical protein AB8A31_16445 [Tardiphaga sp. 804_B3_N1_9]|uniref:hypothetical protein n=1 Tax=Tardiphaga sp. 804_B3_N1_9 TaxID=3240786 RepID=UPI003F2569A9